MKSHRNIILIAALCATFAVASPASAPASSLLSGYGGPGQGSQAILGSAVVTAPGAGGPPHGGGGSSPGAHESSGSLASEPPPSQARGEAAAGGGSLGGSASGGSRGPERSGRAARGDRAARGAGGSHAPAPRGAAQTAASFYPASERIPAGASSGTLGLSASDLALIAIGFALLVLVGLLTGRLARVGAAPAEGQRRAG